jgi:hypothetical protein
MKTFRTAIALAALLIAAPAMACEEHPLAGGVNSLQRGGYYAYDSSQPGAYRVPGGTVLPGAAQSPGCGGGVGQYPCPPPVYVPDRR